MIKSTSLPSPSSLTVLAAAFLLTACGCLPCDFSSSDDATNSSTATPISYYGLSPTAPPPPQLEDIPERTSPRTQIWRPGYWDYSGGDFHWVAGEMLDRPSPTATWSPDHWLQHTYGWAFVPGYWQ